MRGEGVWSPHLLGVFLYWRCMLVALHDTVYPRPITSPFGILYDMVSHERGGVFLQQHACIKIKRLIPVSV